MTKFHKIVGIVIAGIVVGLLFTAVSKQEIVSESPKVKGVYEQVINEFSEGLKAGKTNQFVIDNTGTLTASGALVTTGSITATNSGTSTLNMKSTSTTKGFCTEFNATSSATVLNLTYAASTTASTAVGIAPIVRYGACN